MAETGQRVARGQALATIYSPEVLQAQQELLTAARLEQPAARARPCPTTATWPARGPGRRRPPPAGAAGHLGPGDRRGRQDAAKPQRAIAIRSPGRRARDRQERGPGHERRRPACRCSRWPTCPRVWVVAEVYESDVPRVRVGQPARFEPSAYPGESFSGQGAVRLPDPGRRSSRTLRRAPGVQEPHRPGGLEAAPGHVRRRVARPARHQRADGAGRGGGRHGRPAIRVRGQARAAASSPGA